MAKQQYNKCSLHLKSNEILFTIRVVSISVDFYFVKSLKQTFSYQLKMGYDFARFVREIDDGFSCSICSMVMENPVQSPCEHPFCGECITEWIKVNGSCPVDGIALNFDDLKPTPKYFRTMVEVKEIRCNFGKMNRVRVDVS